MAIATRNLGRAVSFLTILFLGFPVGRTRVKFLCDDCGRGWRDDVANAA